MVKLMYINKKGMYGLKQAAILAYDNLQSNLKPFGYAPVIGTVGIWQHNTRSTTFCLCVDDFGVKYSKSDDTQHLLNSIRANYKYTCDWTGSNYCGLTIEWNYEQGYVDISMPDYVQKTLARLQHTPKVSHQYSPHAHIPIVYATKNTR